ncbi:MAG: 23S rRNA (pseudouridine(1915)-N(3))-methyltransferase RlmH [Rhodospirillales bacterium]|nr:23S rRNA (pseudouridine(1915)-N(3))-methyltransferase RlmH [Rhodospirillales bacterium]MCW8861020.1 23S rRNA (pseudouridine(1915)-N(3))-methyltransferase RlmH [Rhodospirillales bacterium]MCW8952370.1 23S rRNA (pseudouridine(1915)-N(3))-methyltransferase RlmH [Rhodospirillales bacterium]MCW8970504.1 23S rRNA (pseudouridine(1915)-N(3))-methyltransferase RlmH [Rhodospirillales bacterium]MCW9001989.1 23S rRNA (pseudouridine(1915)-N(3))-methyltransferase RlmH [Rhodospirillales bacterium]
MRHHIIAVGRARSGPERDLYEAFTRRITWPLSLREVEEKKPLPQPRLTEREGELLLAAVPDGAVVIALDETGKAMPSLIFAERIGVWRDEGRGDVAFLIGGADGHANKVRQRADLILSFGKMTWPHMMVRAMLVEQIYRAQCILSGHPYHRE